MSRVQARYFINENNEQEWAEASYAVGAKIRYSRRKDIFEVKCLDVFEFSHYGNKQRISVYINEADLLRMIEVDRGYSKEEKQDFYYKRLLDDIEKGDLDDDTFNCVSVCQYFFNMSKRLVSVLAKRKEHLHRLGKTDSSFLELKRRDLSEKGKGGRPKGSKNKDRENIFTVDVTKLDKDEAERILYNRSIFNEALKMYAKRGDIETCKEMCKEAGIRFSRKMLEGKTIL